MWPTETITIQETLSNKEFMSMFAIFLGIVIIYNLVRILLFKAREERVKDIIEQLKKENQDEKFRSNKNNAAKNAPVSEEADEEEYINEEEYIDEDEYVDEDEFVDEEFADDEQYADDENEEIEGDTDSDMEEREITEEDEEDFEVDEEDIIRDEPSKNIFSRFIKKEDESLTAGQESEVVEEDEKPSVVHYEDLSEFDAFI